MGHLRNAVRVLESLFDGRMNRPVGSRRRVNRVHRVVDGVHLHDVGLIVLVKSTSIRRLLHER
jgi:hypothetical protein